MASKKVKNPKKTKEKIQQPGANKVGDKQTIENHMKAAKHHQEAAKHHLEAAKHYADGNHEKASRSTILAHGHHTLAGEFLNDDAKHHAQTLKDTNHHL